MSHVIILHNQARFSLINNGLVRMEYSRNGVFEDRTSIRMEKSHNTIPFCKVNQIENMTELYTDSFIILFEYNEQPFSKDNLRIVDFEYNLIWTPGQIDYSNFGGVHMAMDCIQRNIIPMGVHPATTEFHENSTRFHLWSYIFGNEHEIDPDAHYGEEMITLEQLVTMKSSRELNPHLRELLAERSKYPPGLLSSMGYFLYNDSSQPVIDYHGNPVNRHNDNLDYYFFYYGNDYKTALKNYRLLFGPTPMIPRYSLGLWFSRYPTYRQKELLNLLDTFQDYDLPLDIIVLDLEWHLNGWYGFDWNKTHFPDPIAFIDTLKEHNIHITLNVHPDGIPIKDTNFNTFLEKANLSISGDNIQDLVFHDFDISEPLTKDAFMEVFHQSPLEMGIDFWWIDGHAKTSKSNLGDQFYTNQIYFEYIRKNFPDRRPLICSRTEGFGSHRFPFHFTGDTYSQYETLHSQVEYTMRAGHMGQSFVTHDIGGHMWKYKHVDTELLCRWYQFGAMSPIFRLHSSDGSARLPWLYDDYAVASLKASMTFRMELLPYLYSLTRESHDTGLPMVRSNLLERPSWYHGYQLWDSYYLGDRIYCTPICQPGGFRQAILPPGTWYSGFDHSILESNGECRHFLLNYTHQAPPHFYKSGTLMVKQEYATRAAVLPAKLIIEFYMDSAPIDDTFCLYEDDGYSNQFEKNHYSITKFHIQGSNPLTLSISQEVKGKPILPDNRTYDLKIYCSQPLRIFLESSSIDKTLLKQEHHSHICYLYKDIKGINQELTLQIIQ